MERNEFRFGDTVSSKFHLSCDRETHFLLPELQTFTKTIPGLDGFVDFGIGGYGPRTISADVYYDGDYATLRANKEAIIAWLYSDHGTYKQLEFGDEDGKYYMAKITGELNFTNSSDRKIGTIQWVCNPPWQYKGGILLTPDEITWQTTTPDTTYSALTATMKNSSAIFKTGYGDTSQATFVDATAAQLAFNGSSVGNIVNPVFKSTGKNHFNAQASPDYTVHATITSCCSGGFLISDTSSGTYGGASWTKHLIHNATYHISYQSTSTGNLGGSVSVYDSNSNYLAGAGLNGNFSFTVPANGTVQIFFFTNKTPAGQYTATFSSIMLSYDGSAYETYKASTLSITGTIGQNDRFTWDTLTGRINGSAVTTTGNLIAYQNGWVFVQNSDGTTATVVPVSEITYYQGFTSKTDETRLMQNFTSSGHMRFSNVGTIAVKPKITLIGYIPSGLNLTYGTAQWQYNANLYYDSIIIDCAAETVLRGSDGATLMPYVDSTKDAFFEFQPGQINIDVTASGLGAWPQDLTIMVEFVPIVMG